MPDADNILLVLRGLSVTQPIKVELIKSHNHVWCIRSSDSTFYLKTYTKDWYGDDPASTDFCVVHETAAWEIMQRNSVASPEVIGASTTCENPLGRPFVITRAMEGLPLTDLLSTAADSGSSLLHAVGAYLRRLHSIAFRFPGYLTAPEGPGKSPDSSEWQHRCWSAESRQANALEQLEHDRTAISVATYDLARSRCGSIIERLAAVYTPPRFTHGDCHAHQFFVELDHSQQPIVTGVIDIEVSSAGDCGEDLLKLMIELAQIMPHATRWWIALFAGYGVAPDFDEFRLRLLGVSPIEFWRAGHWMRTNNRETQLQRFLFASDWDELFQPVI